MLASIILVSDSSLVVGKNICWVLFDNFRGIGFHCNSCTAFLLSGINQNRTQVSLSQNEFYQQSNVQLLTQGPEAGQVSGKYFSATLHWRLNEQFQLLPGDIAIWESGIRLKWPIIVQTGMYCVCSLWFNGALTAWPCSGMYWAPSFGSHPNWARMGSGWTNGLGLGRPKNL